MATTVLLLYEGKDIVAKTCTDSMGYFGFENVAQGRYRLHYIPDTIYRGLLRPYLGVSADYSSPMFALHPHEVKDIQASFYQDVITGSGSTEKSKELVIYPNPASDYVHTDLPKDTYYEVWDSQGRKVHLGSSIDHEVRLDISSWASGPYLITVYKEDGQSYGRFIKM